MFIDLTQGITDSHVKRDLISVKRDLIDLTQGITDAHVMVFLDTMLPVNATDTWGTSIAKRTFRSVLWYRPALECILLLL